MMPADGHGRRLPDELLELLGPGRRESVGDTVASKPISSAIASTR